MTDEPRREGANKFRSHGKVLALTVDALLAALTLIGCAWALDIHDALGWVIYIQQYLALILGVGLVACFLGVKVSRSEPAQRGIPWYDGLAVITSLIACGYVVVYYPVIVNNLGALTTERWVFGGLMAILVFEATRRLAGWALVWLAVIVVLYTAYSHLLPGVLYAPNSEWTRIAAYLYLDGNGILGLPLNVFSTLIITFILFGRSLYAVGGDKILADASLVIVGRFRGGPAKVSVVGSSLFGTISGSVIANVMIDGPVTIPMMVRTGYPSHLAAAIEAVASNGGQIMPPVMGITAFLIADWLSIPYAQVAVAALFPAILYYVALFVQVDLEAARSGLVGLPAKDLPPVGPVLRRSAVFVVPLAVLAYTLVFAAWQPGKSAMAAVFAALATGTMFRDTRPTPAAIWEAVLHTGRTLLDLLAIVAVAGVIIGGLQLSGLAFSLSLVLVTLAAGSLIVLLLLTAALSIVLGMGLPTSVIYILLASLVAPALMEFGIPALAAHMFLFYFGTLSSITPPLCFATFAAASIAGCNFWQAGWAGVRLAFVAYIVPFVFVWQPELLMIGTPEQVLFAALTSTVGVFLIAAGFVGYVFGPLTIAQRIFLCMSGIGLIPSPVGSHALIAANAFGLLIGLGVLIPQFLRQRRARRASVKAVSP